MAPKIPSEADMIRVLVREALDARKAAREPAKPARHRSHEPHQERSDGSLSGQDSEPLQGNARPS